MGFYNHDFEVNEEKTADFLENAVSKITTEEDIDTLTQLIKLFKKNVPLSRRKYVTAYMLKETLKHYHSFSKNNNRNGRNSGHNHEDRNYKNDYKAQNRNEKSFGENEEISETEERARTPRVQIDPDKATSIFIGIGKNRRVYPRDLVGLLIAVAGIERDRIGDIKVLANYSFVQLYTEDAQTAIDKLNEYSYRGRKLAVSYSRQKSDEEGNETGVIEEGFANDQISEQQMAEEDAAAYAAAEKAAADKEPFGV